MRSKGTNKRSNTYVRNRLKKKQAHESSQQQPHKKSKRAHRLLLKSQPAQNYPRESIAFSRGVMRFGSIKVDGINESSRQSVETMLYEKDFDVSCFSLRSSMF